MQIDHFNQHSSGFGISPEAFMARSSGPFRPSITFNADSGAGDGGDSSGGSDPTPESGEDTSGLKNALAAERKRANDAEKQYKQLQQSLEGIDPAAAKQAMESVKKFQEQQEAWNQKETELTNKLSDDFNRKLSATSKEAENWKGQYQDLLMRTLAQQAYESAGGRGGGSDDGITFFDAFFNNVRGQLRLGEKGQLEVVDGNGARIFSKKNTAEPMSANEFFSSQSNHAVYSHYFRADNNSKGGGMQPGAGNYKQAGVRYIDRSNIAALSEPGVLEAIAKGDGSVIVR